MSTPEELGEVDDEPEIDDPVTAAAAQTQENAPELQATVTAISTLAAEISLNVPPAVNDSATPVVFTNHQSTSTITLVFPFIRPSSYYVTPSSTSLTIHLDYKPIIITSAHKFGGVSCDLSNDKLRVVIKKVVAGHWSSITTNGYLTALEEHVEVGEGVTAAAPLEEIHDGTGEQANDLKARGVEMAEPAVIKGIVFETTCSLS